MTGFSMDSVTEGSTFAAVAGSWDANFPVTLLSDKRNPTIVGRATGGSVSFSAVFPASAPIQFVGICAHTIAAGNLRVRLFSDAGMSSMVADSGTVAVWPVGGIVQGCKPTRPVVFPALVTARAALVELTGLSGTTDIGCVEIADYFNLPGVSPGHGIGVAPAGSGQRLVGGGILPVDEWAPRTFEGQVDFLHMSITSTRGFDFQALTGISEPFVFVEDYLTPATWARGCWLARNIELPAMVGAVYRHDVFPFRVKEHDR